MGSLHLYFTNNIPDVDKAYRYWEKAGYRVLVKLSDFNEPFVETFNRLFSAATTTITINNCTKIVFVTNRANKLLFVTNNCGECSILLADFTKRRAFSIPVIHCGDRR